jgi:hypothetical protein
MRTAQQIKDDAIARYNGETQANGMLTRLDITDFLAQLAPEMDKVEELRAFLDELPFFRPGDKEKVLKDLKSYGL